MGKVFVILVSYNSKRFLDGCLKSLLAQNYGNIKIVIVDNASPDGSNAYIEENFPQATLLKESKNGGFGKACNTGAKYALEHGADYVLFLNVDTMAAPNLITELVKYAGPDSAATCFTYNDRDTLKPWYSGGRLNKETLDSEQTLYSYDPSHGPTEVEFISGCCMMVHRDTFAKVGFFDESYFMYYEDAEYCARLRQHGIKLLYIQSTKLFHYEGGSQPGIALVNRQSIYYCARNRLQLASQHPELLETSPTTFLKGILKHFPVISPSKNWFQYEKKGIADFLASRSGRMDPLAVEPGYGFWERETDGSNEFIHCVRSRSFLQLHNYSYEDTPIHLTFQINPPPTKSGCRITISIDGKNPEEYTAPCRFDKIIRLKAQDMVLLEFNCEDYPSSVDRNGGREIYFTLSSMSHREASSLEVLKSSSISYDETDGSSRWNWVTDRTSRLTFWNFSDTDRDFSVKALLTPPPNFRGGSVCVRCDGRILHEGIGLPGQLNETLHIEKGCTATLSFEYKGELGYAGTDPRTFAFALHNLEVLQNNGK